jgi:transcriptional regulator with XRE-family HTH domain
MLIMEDTQPVSPLVNLAEIVDRYIVQAGGKKYGKAHLRLPPDPSRDPLGALRYHCASASQGEVAAAVGTAAPTISKWERTGRCVTPSRRKEIAALYGVPDSVLEDIEWHLRRRVALPEAGVSPTPRPVRWTKELLERKAAELNAREAGVAARERESDEKAEELRQKADNFTHQITGLRFKMQGVMASIDVLDIVARGMADEAEECKTPQRLRIA